ncbi:hypothetical protein KCU71_g186, partial [Aureobasidium melanogenum]
LNEKPSRSCCILVWRDCFGLQVQDLLAQVGLIVVVCAGPVEEVSQTGLVPTIGPCVRGIQATEIRRRKKYPENGVGLEAGPTTNHKANLGPDNYGAIEAATVVPRTGVFAIYALPTDIAIVYGGTSASFLLSLVHLRTPQTHIVQTNCRQSQIESSTDGASNPPLLLSLEFAIFEQLVNNSTFSGLSAKMHEHVYQLMRRTAIPRSRDGCRTCRLRKVIIVKCDETRPICGCCTKSKKDCVWGQIWKFSDSSPTVRRNYKIVPRADRRTWDASTRLNSPVRQRTDVDATPLENTTGEEASQTLRRSSAEDTPGEDVSRGFSRAFNIILTPDSYPSLMTLEKDARTDSESKQQLGFKMCTSDDPDIVFLHELGDENLSFTTPKPSAGRKSDRTSNLGPQPLCNTPSRSTQDDDHYVHHFQDVVAKKLIPHDTSAQIDGTRCPGHVIVSLSQTWEPLHHAICAISTLILALDGRQNLLAESFRRYSWAIKAVIKKGDDSSTTVPTGASLYLHFVLLLFDICCASRDFLQEKQVWTAHIDQLARLAYQADPVDDVQASLLWYALQLDMNSCLAGDVEAGSLVRAYKANECQSPFRYRLRCPSAKSANKTYDGTAYNHILGIENLIYTRLAELSQLAAETRARVELDPASIIDVQQQIIQFRNHLQQCWQQRLWKFLSVGLERHVRGSGMRSDRDWQCLTGLHVGLYAMHSRTYGFAEHICQSSEENCSGGMDWITLSRVHGIRNINHCRHAKQIENLVTVTSISKSQADLFTRTKKFRITHEEPTLENSRKKVFYNSLLIHDPVPEVVVHSTNCDHPCQVYKHSRMVDNMTLVRTCDKDHDYSFRATPPSLTEIRARQTSQLPEHLMVSNEFRLPLAFGMSYHGTQDLLLTGNIFRFTPSLMTSSREEIFHDLEMCVMH